MCTETFNKSKIFLFDNIQIEKIHDYFSQKTNHLEGAPFQVYSKKLQWIRFLLIIQHKL